MKNQSHALTLNVQASTPEDFRVLLKQALYEIEKVLPQSADATLEDRNSRVAASWSSPEARMASGRMDGTLGSYSFEVVRGPAAYAALERELLELGYRKARANGFLADPEHFYELGEDRKVIAGEPPAIQEYKAE